MAVAAAEAPRDGQRIGSALLTLLVLAGALAASAQAAGAASFSPPAGCQMTMTVQNRSCTVSQYYTCSADPEGHRRSAHFGQDGLFHLSVIDAETRWIESQSTGSGLIDRLVEGAADDASFTELLETGRDEFDFETRTDDGQSLRHQGFDILTGETVTIDGQDLERTEFQLTTRSADGEVLVERSGSQYVSREFGRFFGGIETSSDWTGARNQTNDSPVLFIFPGEAGFGSTTPQFDCDQLMTQIPQERAAS
ncbi:hypothetical protein E4191_14425 [Paracoccus liaowanqingii]|uniref:DUF3108 domain-containing protein n=1 Tax=Paracoccus liaowanqingii TaxID=2560053 RepID=A0A4P7HR02_9RHOB|nr:hypothetical protein [Paracoccus liaowanqingii]QBX35751.1 hypothetical protein E4191_14425 [Paracoccus liaowanqingii]